MVIIKVMITAYRALVHPPRIPREGRRLAFVAFGFRRRLQVVHGLVGGHLLGVQHAPCTAQPLLSNGAQPGQRSPEILSAQIDRAVGLQTRRA